MTGRNKLFVMVIFGVVGFGVAILLLAWGYDNYLSSGVAMRNGDTTVAVPVRPAHHRVFQRTQEEAQRFIDANRTIRLTPSQEKVRVEALSQLPALCCGAYTAATCCCDCNLSQTIWGLSKSLIVEGANAAEVREAVQSWTTTLNPAGYAGNACFVGGCSGSLTQDACGGMDPNSLVF